MEEISSTTRPERFEDQMLELIGAVARLTGLQVVWKNASGLGEGGLPLPVYSHCNPFCLTVKASAQGLERCTRDDNVSSAQRARDARRPFLKTCHAGVTELVVPLFDDERFAGLLFLGPVRQEDAVCGVRAAASAFAALPLADPATFEAAAVLLAALAANLGEQKRRLRLRSAESRPLDPRIARAVELIKRDLHQPLRAAALARACCLSTSRFIHLFKDSLGVPLSDYIAQRRIERAQELLRCTDLAMSRIASETGFANQNYFATVFRRHTGAAPRQYRARTRAAANP